MQTDRILTSLNEFASPARFHRFHWNKRNANQHRLFKLADCQHLKMFKYESMVISSNPFYNNESWKKKVTDNEIVPYLSNGPASLMLLLQLSSSSSMIGSRSDNTFVLGFILFNVRRETVHVNCNLGSLEDWFLYIFK